MSHRMMILPVDPQAWNDPNDPHNEKPKPTSNLRIDKNKFWAEFRQVFTDDPMGERLELAIQETTNDWGYEGKNHYHYVSFSPYTQNTYRFVSWFRKFIPIEYTLYVFAVGDWDRLVYTDKTSDEDVKAFLGHQG